MCSSDLYIGPGQGETFSIGTVGVRLLVTGHDTGGQSSVEEFTVPVGFNGPPVHAHERTDHGWYVLEGAATFVVDDRTMEVVPGGFVFIPAGTAHSFANHSIRPMRLLEFTTPGGFAEYLRDLGSAVGDGHEMDPEIVGDVMRRHDTFPVT